uniref:Uncharacterized protein n=1 Tax=Bursaphelenchus xylophilus TaxID=6326 RepID=A0A1I7SU89_BURXY
MKLSERHEIDNRCKSRPKNNSRQQASGGKAAGDRRLTCHRARNPDGICKKRGKARTSIALFQSAKAEKRADYGNTNGVI